MMNMAEVWLSECLVFLNNICVGLKKSFFEESLNQPIENYLISGVTAEKLRIFLKNKSSFCDVFFVLFL